MMKIMRDRNGRIIPQPGAVYLDGENSELCYDCAVESDSEDEVPQFRPVVAVANHDEEARCDHCSEPLDYMEE